MNELLEKAKQLVMNDTVKKEIFTDIEICCTDDNILANEICKNILSQYSKQNLIDFISAVENGYNICFGGWEKDGKQYPKIV